MDANTAMSAAIKRLPSINIIFMSVRFKIYLYRFMPIRIQISIKIYNI